MNRLISIIILLSAIFLTACGGGGGSDTNTETVAPSTSVVGVFSVEQPIASADISLKDANGTIKTTVTDVNGVYYIDTSGMKPPFIIKGSYTNASVPYTYYSYLSGSSSIADNAKANINEFTTVATTLLVSQSGNGNDPATLFSETGANRTTILNTDTSKALTALTNLICPILLSADQQTSVGCKFADGENFINMNYAADPTVNDIEKLAMLIDVTIDPANGDLKATDSSGTTIALVTMEQILTDTISTDAEINLATAAQINNLLASLTKQDPLLNETLATQLSSGSNVSDEVEYNSNFPNASLQVNNLTECPVEVRNIKVTYMNPEDNLEVPDVPFNGNHTPLIDTVVPEATMGPVDSCKRFSFTYEYEYNAVIRKTQTGLVDGVPVWEYDVPACENYSNKVVESLLEETYKYTDADFGLLFNRPAIEVRPELYKKTNSWPDSSVTFIYPAECPIVAGFSLSPLYGAAPLDVNVDASNSAGNITSYEWASSAGDTSTGITQSFSFSTAGTYTISLTVSDGNGKTDTIQKTVTVDALPQASFSSSAGVSEFKVNLDASSSIGAGISNYQWVASDGQTTSGETASFTFSSAGDYSVTLTITDRNGNVSSVTNTVTAEEITEVTHNGVTYGIVTSPTTGKKWLDRNLGSSSVCTAYNDSSCYGDYYQWGRAADGHEKTSSSTTTVQANSVDSVGSQFIVNLNDDWTTIDSWGNLRKANWNKSDGTGICPIGFRVPTSNEFRNENLTDPFNSFLKIPTAGYRNGSSVIYAATYGFYWSTNVDIDGMSSEHFYLGFGTGIYTNIRSWGESVRCIAN